MSTYVYSGRRRQRRRYSNSLGINGDAERLLVHRELEALRNPTPRRFRKLEQARRAAA
jgi:hypothetical protein